jgi:dipeptidyl aminopeptidase/acylaminoacyl peptidase
MRKSHCLVVLAGLLLVFAALAAAQSFTVEQIIKSPFPSEMTAAPRGNRIAWVFNAEGKRNIWVAEGPRFVARQLTPYKGDDGQEITSLAFSVPNGDFIVFVRGGPKNDAGEVPNPTSEPEGAEQSVWVASWQGGLRKIDNGNSPSVSPRGDWVAYVKDGQIWIATLVSRREGHAMYFPKPKAVVARGRNGSPVWSPDGSKLAFVSNRTTHSFIAVYEPAKRKLWYVAPSVDRDTTPRWSLDGKSIAFVRAPARVPGEPFDADRPNPWSIWVADIASNTGREVWRSADTPDGSVPRMAGEALLNWAADDRLVFTSEQDGWQHLYSMPATGGTPVLLTPGECEYEQMTFTPGRREIIFSSNCGDIDRRHLQRVSVAGGTPQPITSGEGLEWAPAVSSDGKWLAHFASTTSVPAMPHVRPLAATGEGRMLAAQALPKDWPGAQLVVPQQVVFNAPDGLRIHNQLFVPRDLKSGDRRPAVIFMHGGPARQMMLGFHNRGYYHRAYALNQYLASRGYVVLSVNYRSGIGYGRAFREAKDRGVRGASEYQDIVAAGRYLQSRADVDPARIGLWGGSYGGYLTALGLARNSDIFAAGVDLHGVHNRTTGRGAAAGNPDARRLAWHSSPVADVDKWRSPVLLIHADDDRNVDFAQTVELAARLRQRGVIFEQIVYPDDVHDFLLHRRWLEVYQATAAFFDKHLKNAGASRADAGGR